MTFLWSPLCHSYINLSRRKWFPSKTANMQSGTSDESFMNAIASGWWARQLVWWAVIWDLGSEFEDLNLSLYMWVTYVWDKDFFLGGGRGGEGFLTLSGENPPGDFISFSYRTWTRKIYQNSAGVALSYSVAMLRRSPFLWDQMLDLDSEWLSSVHMWISKRVCL